MELKALSISRPQSGLAAPTGFPTSSSVHATGTPSAVRAQTLGLKCSSFNGKSLNDVVGITGRRFQCNAGRRKGGLVEVKAEQLDNLIQNPRGTVPGTHDSVDKETLTLIGTVKLSRLIGDKGQQCTIEFPQFQKNVLFMLVSTVLDEQGKLMTSDKAQLKAALKAHPGNDTYLVEFNVPHDFGEPGALIVDSSNPEEFYLQFLNLNSSDSSTTYEFPCNSWVNCVRKDQYKKYFNNKISDSDRIFFTNKVFLPSDTPSGLQKLRILEMENMRGDGTGERKVQDRVYDYDVYNDLGIPREAYRQILGGAGNLPYPRRCRTGRKIYPEWGLEELPLENEKRYVPRDEEWGLVKQGGFNADSLLGITKTLLPIFREKFDETPDDFDTFKEIYNLYKNGLKLFPESPANQPSEEIKEAVFQFLDDYVFGQVGGIPGGTIDSIKYPVPQVIADEAFTWMDDEEFGRQTLSGMNPAVIRRAEFPPTSDLPEETYGPATALTADHVEPHLSSNGNTLTVTEALDQKRLFTVDYHDVLLPYVNKIESQEGTKRKVYAPRAIFFLTDDNKIKPVAIELSRPPLENGESTSSHAVFTPSLKGELDINYTWELAKLHFNCVDFGYHAVVTHWLRCHCVMEPFLLASHRQMSAIHPIFVLLDPCFVNTLRINANARASLINAAPLGTLESTVTAGMYGAELTAVAYDKYWRFDKLALPQDLLDRGMAQHDPSSPGGVKLLFEDYPYAKDALDVWDATKEYISNYVKLYYKSDDQVQGDVELQAWWKEIREVGHGDKKDQAWWPSCKSVDSLIDVLSTIFWISLNHAPVNFGQYAYSGFTLNRPPMTRELIPEPNTLEYREMLFNFERYMLKTTSAPQQAVIMMTTMMVLSNHALDEEYIGERLQSNQNWTSDPRAIEVFDKYAQRVKEIQCKINSRNENPQLQNRRGALDTPGYTLLYPKSGPGITGQGVPWSIAI